MLFKATERSGIGFMKVQVDYHKKDMLWVAGDGLAINIAYIDHRVRKVQEALKGKKYNGYSPLSPSILCYLIHNIHSIEKRRGGK